MRTFALAALMIALLPASAFSQQEKGPLTSRSDEDKKTDAELDRAYRNTVKSTTDKQQAAPAKTDPWQTVRPAGGDTKR
jgi:hypothetical protein